jgi:phosphoglycerate dehydrogenase-like enzyme
VENNLSFRVGVTSDILDSRGEPAFGREPLKALDAVQWEWLPRGLKEISADHAATFDALYVNSPRVRAAAVAQADLRLKLISRHGVGYDSVDVPAMTKAGVLVANTPNAVPRPVATIALTFVLALAHRLMAKDRITRAGRWAERLDLMGTGLTGRTLSVSSSNTSAPARSRWPS